MENIVLSWSGGKDSAMTLFSVKQEAKYNVVALLTTVNEANNRSSMHGVRMEFVQRQAHALGIPLDSIGLSENCTNEEYEAKMNAAMLAYKARGIRTVAFGDLFLEGIRRYREENLSKVGMNPIFPLWGRGTKSLLQEFLDTGHRAIITFVDTKALDKSFAGREIDAGFLSDLPAGVDPCGENGEYHSFVFDGPMFKAPIEFKVGEKVLKREQFYYCDIV